MSEEEKRETVLDSPKSPRFAAGRIQYLIEQHDRRARNLRALLPLVEKLEGDAEAAMYQLLLDQRP